MTDAQYKGMLLDAQWNWRQVLRTAQEESAEKTAAFAQEQIDLIDRKLKF